MKMKLGKLLTVALFLKLSATSAAAGTIVLSDVTFNTADYATRTDGSVAHNSLYSTNGTQVPIGGNPGSFLQVVNNTNNHGLVTERVFGWHFNVAQPYDPADGAIESIDYSEDSILVFGNAPQGRFALRQDDILFRSKASFATGGSTVDFKNNQLQDLVPSDFEALINGTFFPTASPDFSESGSPIEFGFLRFSTNRNGVNDSTGVDNWVVTLSTEQIPEPNTTLLALVGVGLFAHSRKRM